MEDVYLHQPARSTHACAFRAYVGVSHRWQDDDQTQIDLLIPVIVLVRHGCSCLFADVEDVGR